MPVFKEMDTWYDCECLENTGNIVLNLRPLQQLLWVKELLSMFLGQMPR